MRGSTRVMVGTRGGAVRGAGSRGFSLVTGTTRSRGRDVFRECTARTLVVSLPVLIANVGFRDGGDRLGACDDGGGSDDAGGADAGETGFCDLPVSLRMNEEKEDPDR